MIMRNHYLSFNELSKFYADIDNPSIKKFVIPLVGDINISNGFRGILEPEK